ncbi:MAG: glycosyl hydrolase 2 galactose-binding domain-containing protein, partial [Syntrophothermus sp.]
MTPARVRVHAHHRTELDSGWEAASCPPDACTGPTEASALEWIAAAVPGTAAGALAAAGRWSPGEPRDFDAEDWWFRVGFEASPAGPGEEVVLCLAGIATASEVFLNGELVAERGSMFRADAIEVGSLLRDGGNELAIRCRALASLLGGRRRPRARWRSRLADNRLRFHRTMLLGRCPGFAPGPATVGPWRPIWIERRRGFAVESLRLRPRCEGEGGELAVEATLRPLGPAPDAGRLVLGGAGVAEATLAVAERGDGLVELTGSVRLDPVERWWPHTHGAPALYDVRLFLSGPGGETRLDAGRVGFREIAPGPDPSWDPVEMGLDLHVNGVRTFARGVVWTPLDPVGMAPSREALGGALGRFRAAGMNMVRIPGT